ncbi:FHA domain-containing protein [Candidatus Sumerlaeota bacterium]|nr:FHA domain-containing protein [Candidatus Sumerlaeota bacterium]
MAASLLVDGTGNWVINYQLKKDRENRLGRTADNDVAIPGTQISSRHAVIYYSAGKWVLRDESKNGTYVNDQRVTGEHLLNTGDAIRIGKTIVQFRDPEQELEDDQHGLTIWGATAHKFHMQSEQLKENIREASAKGSSVIELPEAIVEYKTEPGRQAIKVGSDTPEDKLWVAEKLSELLGDLATKANIDKIETFDFLLERIKGMISAENGFLMIINQGSNSWEIRSWAGSVEQWSSYEKEHPIPLSVANKSFMEKITIALSPDAPPPQADGVSLLHLQVKSYICVPLLKDGQAWGVVYFDNRLGTAPFARKHVQLLERAAPFILQIEFQ